mgnify:CR=1 FL=1
MPEGIFTRVVFRDFCFFFFVLTLKEKRCRGFFFHFVLHPRDKARGQERLLRWFTRARGWRMMEFTMEFKSKKVRTDCERIIKMVGSERNTHWHRQSLSPFSSLETCPWPREFHSFPYKKYRVSDQIRILFQKNKISIFY